MEFRRAHPYMPFLIAVGMAALGAIGVTSQYPAIQGFAGFVILVVPEIHGRQFLR